jgi:hypothetical protein
MTGGLGLSWKRRSFAASHPCLRVAFPAKRDGGAPHGLIPAEGEGKIVKFRASFSEDQETDLD